MPGRYVVAQLGARMHYAVPRILHKEGVLEKLFTDLYWPENGYAAKFSNLFLPSRLNGKLIRNNPQFSADVIEYSNFIGLSTKLLLRLSKSPFFKARVNVLAARLLAKRISRIEPKLGEKTVYGFDTASLELFQTAKRVGAKLILEQCIVPRAAQKSRLLKLIDAPESVCADQISAWNLLGKREVNEWQLADFIICPSKFVMDEIKANGGPSEKLVLVPYGVPCRSQAEIEGVMVQRRLSERRPLRVLFVGEVGYRKGCMDLLTVASSLPNSDFEFRAAGRLALTSHHAESFKSQIRWLGHLSPGELINEYSNADIFLLPSYLEGSATVAYEALSWGLPTITTHSSGTVVQDGISGFVGEAGNVNFLIASLQKLFEQKEMRIKMAENAWLRSLEFSLENYGSRLLETLRLSFGDG